MNDVIHDCENFVPATHHCLLFGFILKPSSNQERDVVVSQKKTSRRTPASSFKERKELLHSSIHAMCHGLSLSNEDGCDKLTSLQKMMLPFPTERIKAINNSSNQMRDSSTILLDNSNISSLFSIISSIVLSLVEVSALGSRPRSRPDPRPASMY